MTRASRHARRAPRAAPLLTLLLLAASSSLAHVPIRNSAGNALFWAASDRPVQWVMNDAGSDDIADASEQLAVRRAAAAWNAAPGTDVALQELTSPGQQARTDWQANDVHLVLFDETNDSGFFGPGSSIIAVTNVQFSQGSGKILDADLIFNGAQPFATDLSGGAFDVRAVATHELGHLLGLDHSAVVGATMAPYTSSARFEPRSLHADDFAGLRASYPAELPGTGRLEGSVRRDGAAVSGAQVWARADDGRVLAGTLTDDDGLYELDGLPPGALRVVAAPLDGPIVPGFLAGLGQPSFDTAFAPERSGVYALPGSGTLTVDLDVAPDAVLRVLEPLTVRTLQRGATTTVSVRVVGYTPAAGSGVSIPDAGTALSVAGVQFTPLPQAQGDLISFPVSVAADAPVGLYDLRVHTASGDVALVCGYLEVVPPPPLVQGVAPDCSGPTSADELLFFGAHLPAGSEVALGDVDLGLAAESQVGGGLLEAALPALDPGLRDLVVVVPSGQEARAPGAHLAVEGAQPSVTFMYPTTGSAAGGTLVTLVGSGFGPEQIVSLDAQDVTPLFTGDPNVLQFVTPPFAEAGFVGVAVRNPLCDQMLDVAPEDFEVVAGPDMQLIALEPAVLAAQDGGEVRLFADNLPAEALQLLLDFDPVDFGNFAVLPVAEDEPGVLTVQVPPGPAGALDALLANYGLDHTSSLTNALYLAPLLDAGDQLVGALDLPGAVDALLLDGIADTRLTLTLKRTGKKNTLQPGLRVRRADGSVLVSSVEGEPGYDAQLSTSKPKLAKLVKLELPATERYTVELLGVGGSTGAYRLTLKEQLPKTATTLKLPKQGAPAPGAEPVALELLAKQGSRLGGKLKAKDDLVLAGVELESPSGALLISTDANGALQGDPDALGAVTLDAQGRFVRFKKLELPEFGAWTLRLFAAPDTSGPLGGKLSVKPPKGKTVFTESDD